MLNEWGRRSFLGKAVMSPLIVKAWVSKSVTAIIDGDVPDAIRLMRVLNASAAAFNRIEEHPDGTHTLFVPTKAEILDELARRVNEADPTSKYGPFMKSLAPSDRNGEILAGWITDIAARPHDYVIVTSRKVDPKNLSARRDVLITDNDGGIYRAQVLGPTTLTAASLNAATDFPGAVFFDLYRE